jgi:hypothetical protein
LALGAVQKVGKPYQGWVGPAKILLCFPNSVQVHKYILWSGHTGCISTQSTVLCGIIRLLYSLLYFREQSEVFAGTQQTAETAAGQEEPELGEAAHGGEDGMDPTAGGAGGRPTGPGRTAGARRSRPPGHPRRV